MNERLRHLHEQEKFEPCDMATIRNPLGQSAWVSQPDFLEFPTSKAVLGHLLSEKLGVTEAHMVISGNGSSGIIDVIPQLFLSPDDTCTLIVPTYFGLTDSLVAHGTHILHVPADPRQGFAFSHELINRFLYETQKTRPRLIWLCSPNNPTGTVMDRSDIATIATTNEQALVIVDEAYQECIDPDNVDSAIHLLNTHPNIFVTKTLSKAYGSPDLKIGIGIGNPSVIQHINLGLTETPIDISIIRKAVVVLQDRDHLVTSSRYIRSENEYLKKQIRTLHNIELGADSQTGVIILRHTTENIHMLLDLYDVKTKDMNHLDGIAGLQYVRIGVQRHEINEQFIKILKMIDAHTD